MAHFGIHISNVGYASNADIDNNMYILGMHS